MEQTTKNWGGSRPGAGRPSNGFTALIYVKISPEAKEIYDQQKNKSVFIDKLIRNAAKR